MYTRIMQSGVVKAIRDDVCKCFIPLDPANKDYQAYLEWLAVPNTPSDEEVVG